MHKYFSKFKNLIRKEKNLFECAVDIIVNNTMP